MRNSDRLEPLFSSWRPLWSGDATTVAKLARLDALRIRRARGNQHLPHVPAEHVLLNAKRLFTKLEAAYEQPSAGTDSDVQAWKAELAPVLEAERWGRWLHLENALEIASRSGDLLFSALLLRSMCEEVLRLRVLEYPARSPFLTFKTVDDARRAWLAGALLAIGPCARSIENSISPDEPPYFDEALGAAADSILRSRARALNDYVHPNFGSHVLALFPEQSAAASVLLDALTDVYEAFLSMPWAADERSLPGAPLPDPYITTPRKLVARIRERILPDMRSALRQPADAASLRLRELDHWLCRSDWDDDASRRAMEEDGLLDNLEGLVAADDTAKTGAITSRVLALSEQDALPWRHPRTLFLISLSNARRADHWLQEASEAPEASDVGTSAWLTRTAHAVNLALTVSLVKIDLLVVQTACQVASRNQMGSVFCARSLLEHLAVIDWLASRLASHWDAISRRARDGTLSEGHLRSMDAHLARVLTGTKGSLEDDRQWGPHWAEDNAPRSLNVFSAVQAFCAHEPGLQRIYNVCSAMVHGRLLRGLESLDAPTGSPYQLHNLLRGVEIATFACSTDVQMTLRSQCALIGQRLMNLAGAASVPERAHELIPRATLSMDRLKHGRDFTGTGTLEDPIRFVDGMPYHESLYRYCAQFGYDPNPFRQDHAGDLVLDVLEHDGRPIYFAHTLPPTS
jgi:hypothetical protein